MMLGIMVLTLAVLIFALILCVFIATISVAVSAIPCIIIGIWMLFTSFADGVATLGAGFIGLGISILLFMGSIGLGKGLLRMVTCLFGRIAKGGIKHEK